MPKNVTRKFSINVPINVVFLFTKEFYSEMSTLKNKFKTLKKIEYNEINCIENKKYVFQFKRLWTKSVNVYEFKPINNDITEIEVTLSLPWGLMLLSFLTPNATSDAFFLNIESNFRNLEKIYKIVREEK